METQTQTLAPEALPAEITDTKGVPMVLVSAGEFTMGSDNGHENERPAHKVYLGTFYIDKYEVTNSFYRECEFAGACQPHSDINSQLRPSYYGNSDFDNFPVLLPDWNKALGTRRLRARPADCRRRSLTVYPVPTILAAFFSEG